MNYKYCGCSMCRDCVEIVVSLLVVFDLYFERLFFRIYEKVVNFIMIDFFIL